MATHFKFAILSAIVLLKYLALPPVSSATLNLDTDKQALIAIKSAFQTIPPPNPLFSWTNQTSSPCNWVGVTCNTNETRVVALNLAGFQLSGAIDPHIGNLSFLRSLQLQSNQLTGQIPHQINKLFRLRVLNMSFNNLQGPLPSNITTMADLETLDLRSNKINDRLPDELSRLTKLQVLVLAGNRFYGAIPPSFGNLTSLVTINLGTNSIGGSIPTQLSNIPNLKNLIIAVNNLSGTVPPGIYNMSSLVTLTLASNHLWGTFPKDIGEKLPNLLVFIFCFNKFTGTIPASMHNITRIRIIRFGDNFLEGTVPPGLEKLHHLSMYNIRYNKLVGSDANGGLNFITSLTNCSRLAFLTLEGNKFEGVIPDSIGNLSQELSKLYMGENRFYGKIPTTISNLHGLTLLNMSDNSLSGEIPAQMGKLDKLQMLLMARNRLSGSIPSSLGDLRMLNQIDLSGNELVGNIPISFGNFKNLLYLDLSKNKLNGSIPRETLTLPALSKHLNLSNNLLTGSLPKEIGSLQNVVAIDISNNLISGNIPSSISGCKSLEVLIMARNKLSGPIPITFDDLRGLQLLDLSSNHLSGPIPDELQRLNALRTLNLSFNDLEGVVPMELRNITNLYLQGNPKLCGGYFSCATTGTKGMVIKIVVISVLSALLAMFLVFGTVVYFMRRKSKVPLSVSTEWVKGKPEMISHRELCLATDNFCPENMIGKGSFGTVYRGCLEQGIGIAVKVFNTERAGSVRSFLAECEALRHVRHRNLVKLITSCCSIDLKQNEFLALVYEFLSNGSLDSWIHMHKLHENGSGLNLVERLNIAIDVASAMDYLHNGYDVPIVHCDLKPSNIILSEDMTAKVGDFGLARFLMEGETNQSSSITSSRVLKGSIGYVPPEYGVGRKATRAGDVYSFGVTLVELFTGKRPTDEGFSGELSLMKWVELGYPNNMDEIVDAALLESRFNLYYERQKINPRKQYDCLVDVMGVGLCCTANSPDKRISMEDVFVKLKTIRATLVHHSNGNHE
ncbi:probable LRR receptor-like serine/threonine-protein kinase At3g47570 [Cucurbita moschata]|uniref:non-specific serine/threonine protein kinase n=1 Tax=Cucurbita moschata TaxID=3662 RepID=A0A6J1GH31_CUCMO|nr:probable LRR receptor-like serine/threonine-protein kinase At3g47570 [Cucurbita moschata]